MTFFDDYTAALESYANDYVELEIVNVLVPGSALNEGERGTFDVRIRNNGPLSMADVQVRIRGLNGTKVKDAAAIAPYASQFVTSVGQFPTITAHNGSNPQENIGGFGFEAPASAQAPADLVEVTLEEWKADLVHLHVNHSHGSASVKAIHRDRVRAA